MNEKEYPCILAVFAEDTELGKRIAQVLEECGFIPVEGISLSDMKHPSRQSADFFILPHADAADSVHAAPSRLTLHDAEMSHLRNVLGACGWKYKTAAKMLGINRTTLYRKVRKYGLRKEE